MLSSPVDATALESEALAAIAAARVPRRARGGARPLPRPQERAEARAARGARPRDRDGAERASAQRIEEALEARERSSAPSSTGGCARSGLRRRRCPARRRARGHLHLITQIRREIEDVFLGLGLRGLRRPRGRDASTQLRRAQPPGGAPVARRRATRSTSTTRRVLRTHTSPSPDPGDGGAGSRRSTSSRSAASTGATRSTRRTRRSSTRSKGLAVDRGHHARRPARARSTTSLRRSSARSARCGCARASSRSPSRRSSSTSRATSATAPAAASASTPAGSRWAAPAMVDPNVFEFVGYDPERVARASRSGSGLDRIAFAAARAARTCACSGRTTSASLRQF